MKLRALQASLKMAALSPNTTSRRRAPFGLAPLEEARGEEYDKKEVASGARQKTEEELAAQATKKQATRAKARS
jgi:hypothetical protein